MFVDIHICLGSYSSGRTPLMHAVTFTIDTVEPPNRGHFETVAFVLSSEVVLFSEVV